MASIAVAIGSYSVLLKLERRQLEVFDWQTANTVRQIEWVWVSTKLGFQHDRFKSTASKYIANDPSTTHSDLLDQLDIYWGWFNSLDVFSNLLPEDIFESKYLNETEKEMVLTTSKLAIELQTTGLLLLPELERKIAHLKMGDTEFVQQHMQVWYPVLEKFLELQVGVLTLMRNSQIRHDYLSKELQGNLGIAYKAMATVVFLTLMIIGFYLMQKVRDNQKLQRLNNRLRSLAEEKSLIADDMIKLAHHDPLSNLYNRVGFHRQFRKYFDAGGAHGICFLDLDLFKVINDSAGHAAGDKLITELGMILDGHCEYSFEQYRCNKKVPPEFTASRYGGDEFVILCTNCESDEFEEFAKTLFNRIMSYKFEFETREFDISVSVGAYYFDADTTDETKVMASVDAACYEAKNQGGGRLRFYNADHSIIETRQTDVQVIELIQLALNQNQFNLYYQPIVGINPTKTSGNSIELLLRMQDKSGSVVSPAVFLPVAEKYGFMLRIDMWVVRTALDWLESNNIELAGLDHININLSALSISDDEFISELVAMLRGRPGITEKIYFEITETVAVRGNGTENLKTLKATGVGLSLDDFGTGFSSFGYLESLPVDQIKIDGTFVCDIDSNQVHQKFVRAIVTIAQAMKKNVVAEFVENKESMEILKKLGVDSAQGFYIAKPQPLLDMVSVAECLSRAELLAINVDQKPTESQQSARNKSALNQSEGKRPQRVA